MTSTPDPDAVTRVSESELDDYSEDDDVSYETSTVCSDDCISMIRVGELMKENLEKYLQSNMFILRFPQMDQSRLPKTVMEPGYFAFQNDNICAHIKFVLDSHHLMKMSDVKSKVDMVTIVGKQHLEVYSYKANFNTKRDAVKYMQIDNIWQCHREIKKLENLKPHIIQSSLGPRPGDEMICIHLMDNITTLYNHVRSLEQSQSTMIETLDSDDIFKSADLGGEKWSAKLFADVEAEQKILDHPQQRHGTLKRKARVMVPESESDDDEGTSPLKTSKSD